MGKVDGNPSAALAAARSWIEEGGGEAAKLCAAAANLAAGRPKDAAEGFELLAAAPGAPGRRIALLAQAADAWVLAGWPDRAVAVLTEALAIDPTDTTLLLARARAEVDLGRLSEAVDDLTRAIDADSLQVTPYVLRASALRRAGRLDEAALNLDIALMLDSGNPDALLERGLLRRAAGDYDGAREDWQTVVKKAPASEAATLAQHHLGVGKGG
jgi:Flp pilus assembly protein TadD, contains TPR repeats